MCALNVEWCCTVVCALVVVFCYGAYVFITWPDGYKIHTYTFIQLKRHIHTHTHSTHKTWHKGQRQAGRRNYKRFTFVVIFHFSAGNFFLQASKDFFLTVRYNKQHDVCTLHRCVGVGRSR